MQKGALTLLEKPCRDHELWEAILQAIARDTAQRETERERSEIRDRLQSLTSQELQVLRCIVAGKPNKIIAKELDVSIRTVEARRHQLFQKMRSDSVAELVRLVYLVEEVELPQ
jgi:FixJ family two-component response regulator